jgi:hypothetical protein
MRIEQLVAALAALNKANLVMLFKYRPVNSEVLSFFYTM